LGKEKMESSARRLRWDGEVAEKTQMAHAGTRDEIERITETGAKSKMMKEGSSNVPRMTIVQLELTRKAWKKLEAANCR
jgi:hypothetical protein